MDQKQVMATLKALGTAQNRKVYARHGAKEPMFGVSYKNLGELKKKIKRDQALAEKLWATGNHDARNLAAMVVDPDQVTKKTLESWVKEVDCYPETDALARHAAAKSRFARVLMEKWTKSPKQWIGRAGFTVLAILAMEDNTLPDSYFAAYLDTIGTKIKGAKNRTRDAMNTALIAIASRSPRLEKKAMAVAKKIGKVEVDHGETGCKTPDALEYIERSRGRWAQKKARQKSRKSGERPGSKRPSAARNRANKKREPVNPTLSPGR